MPLGRLARLAPCAQAARARFLRCTSSSDTAAGVSPGMRAACPSVCGRTALKHLARLVRQSAHRRVVDIRRQGAVSSWRCWRSISSLWRFRYPEYLACTSTLQLDLRRRAARRRIQPAVGVGRRDGAQVVVRELGAAQQLERMRLRAQSGCPSFAKRACVHIAGPHQQPSRGARARPRRHRACAQRTRQRSSSTSPSSRPQRVRRRSALSSRRDRRYSARLVNMR